MERFTGLLKESFAAMHWNPAGGIFSKKTVQNYKEKENERNWGVKKVTEDVNDSF